MEAENQFAGSIHCHASSDPLLNQPNEESKSKGGRNNNSIFVGENQSLGSNADMHDLLLRNDSLQVI